MNFCAGFGNELAIDGDFAQTDEFGGVATGANAAMGYVFVKGKGFGG